MPYLHRAVLLRAAAAALALSAALGGEAVVGHALAKRGAERAERDAYVCSEAARLATEARAGRSQPGSRPLLAGLARPNRCGGTNH